MIPSDLAARLRMLTEASFFDSEPPVSGTARIREIQARLPQLVPGERFSATLQRPLPDGTFQAIVAGRSYTLALDRSATVGDTLELIVVRNTPKAVVAQLAAPASTSAAGASLSATGRLIGFLLTGQPASQPAALAGGKPLVDTPPGAGAGAAHLAPVLRQALARSGLFYEAHQLQWLSGKLDTAALRLEPQGHLPLARTAGSPAGEPGSASPAAAAGLARGTPAGPPGASSLAAGVVAEFADDLEASLPVAGRASGIPDRLLPIVHQQLDAMATQHYVWQGQMWPGQTVEWEIEDPAGDQDDAGDEAAAHWNTTLRLTLPRLGGMEAELVLTPAGVAMRLVADDPATAAALDASRGRLDDALAAANVPLTGFVAEIRDDGE